MKILLGVSDTQDSRHALERTIERVEETGDDLTVAIFDSEEGDSPSPTFESEVQDMIDTADIEADIEHISGHLGSQLVEMADEGNFDQLVIGAGGRSPLGKLQLGSIPEFVILNAETTVTLIR